MPNYRDNDNEANHRGFLDGIYGCSYRGGREGSEQSYYDAGYAEAKSIIGLASRKGSILDHRD